MEILKNSLENLAEILVLLPCRFRYGPRNLRLSPGSLVPGLAMANSFTDSFAGASNDLQAVSSTRRTPNRTPSMDTRIALR
jgi:hypothetical protein